MPWPPQERNIKLNRRTFVKLASSAAIAGPMLPLSTHARSEYLSKVIPSTGETIPAIGMGTWLTFDVGTNRALQAQRTEVVRRFFDLGGAMIDSSPMYGSSQKVIGNALSSLGSHPTLFATDKVWVSGGENGPAQIAQTRKRWGIDRFDLLQVHNLVSWQAHLETLFAMKAEGQLRYVGVTSYAGLRYDQIERIMTDHPIDFIQITYNLVDREAEQRLLPLAQEKGIAVIANRPFREGALINVAMQRRLPEMAHEIGATNWAQFLLKFIISNPALTVTIPATRRVDHMSENMGALTGAMPDANFRKQMIAAFENS